VAEVSPFEARGDLIDGELTLPGGDVGHIPLEDPGDLRRELGEIPFSRGSIDAAVVAARRAYRAWRDLPQADRAAHLLRLREAIADSAELLASVIATEVGKPLWEARTEVSAMRAKVDISLGPGMDCVREIAFEAQPGQIARARPHARGVLAVLGPFNFPGHLPHGHIVPALATGNTVVFKPSERTAAVGQLYASLVQQAGLPPGVFNMIQGDGAQGAALARHRDVDGVLFTGSYAVGRQILEAALDQPGKLVALELGGKNGVIVCDDADLAAAASAIAYGVAITTGQRCSATSRTIVDRRVAGELAERVVSLLAQIRIGYGFDEDVFMGPLISAASRDRHRRVIEMARAEGAQCLLEGGPTDGPRAGHYVRPSVHRARAPADTAYQMDEHFVPDLCMLEIDDLGDAIAMLDATPYGLAGSIFTQDRDRFERAWRETRLGLLSWNTTTVGASSRLPFGGVKQSGNGFPAGVTSAAYCTYPVASLEVAEPPASLQAPGFPSGIG
jgi:succinylglutamic semialdehyde dehydrogenase